MDVMHEMAPLPTALGYWDHQLPHFFHVGEIALTFAAEIIAPVLVLFGRRAGGGSLSGSGRRSRSASS